jgi:hypothetical protein
MTASEPSEAFSIPKQSVRRAALGIGGLVALVVLVLLVAALVRAIQGTDPLASAINPREYQAVFLNNGQVYFGKLTAQGGDFYDLRRVYSLSTQVTAQSGKKSQRYLVPITNDIQSPEDLMVINRRQILFVENLKPTSPVSKTISSARGP